MFNDCICFVGLIFWLSVIIAYATVDPTEFKSNIGLFAFIALRGLYIGVAANVVYIALLLLALFGASLVR